jgi:hypothetical protein
VYQPIELPATATQSWPARAARASSMLTSQIRGEAFAGRRWREGASFSARSSSSSEVRPYSSRNRSARSTQGSPSESERSDFSP